jgi:hypothetical protein
MSLLSLLVNLFVLLVVVGLFALIVKLRTVGGVRFSLVLLLIIGVLVLTVWSLGKLVAIMLGVILLFLLSFSVLLARKIRHSSPHPSSVVE